MSASFQWADEEEGRERVGAVAVQWPLVPRSAVRVLVVLCSAAVAVVVPNVGLLVSLAGASSGAALSLVCPSLMALYIPDYNYEQPLLSPGLKVGLCGVSIALGVVGAVAGTAVALSDIKNEYFS
jgi:hypothetical protein